MNLIQPLEGNQSGRHICIVSTEKLVIFRAGFQASFHKGTISLVDVLMVTIKASKTNFFVTPYVHVLSDPLVEGQ